MAVLEMLIFPNPQLRKKSQPIPEVTAELRAFSEDMMETMYSFQGIGLAAPQVNRLERIIVLDIRPRENGRYTNEGMTELEKKIPLPLVLINPEIVDKKGQTTYEEGCLSVPSYFETVKRFDWIKVTALDKNGKPLEFEADGLLAICIQHEIDHLDGKLFIDRLSTIKANRIKSKIKKFGYPKREDETQEQRDREL